MAVHLQNDLGESECFRDMECFVRAAEKSCACLLIRGFFHVHQNEIDGMNLISTTKRIVCAHFWISIFSFTYVHPSGNAVYFRLRNNQTNNYNLADSSNLTSW